MAIAAAAVASGYGDGGGGSGVLVILRTLRGERDLFGGMQQFKQSSLQQLKISQSDVSSYMICIELSS